MCGISSRVLEAAFRTFSCGSFLAPGNRLRVARTRPSGCSSAETIMYLSLRPERMTQSRKSTTSTTRTRDLCFEASSISCEKPASTSCAKRSRVFASPLPKVEVSTPHAPSIWARICTGTPDWAMMLVICASCDSEVEEASSCSSLQRGTVPDRSTSAMGRHSKLRSLLARLSRTVKLLWRKTVIGVALQESKLPWLTSALTSCFSFTPARRSTSSRRRSATAGSGCSGIRP
mmetsp:Transcript_117872/g.328326  ORF Transcript_117872/g.328326 Transcript_117872/m.328326 type:complete len:232 (-) Transcript_117872:1358-2053(-)